MATISVLTYGNPTLASINVAKIGITNATTKCSTAQIKVNNNNNNVQKPNLNVKPNNKRSHSVMAKKAKVAPLGETNTNIINTPPPLLLPPPPTTPLPTTPTQTANSASQRSAKLAKTLKRPLPEIDTTVLCRASGGKSKVFPLPVAVARRNARERNRVKQVNNGFSALRDRIPEEVAEAFEAQGSGRGSIKKMSKVETLRMAVEYIRSLERVLEIDSYDADQANASVSDFHLSNESYQLSDTSSVLSTLTPPPSDNISSGSFDDSDGLPDITVIEGHQYVRIPGTNTYQLVEATAADDASFVYENDENIEPMLQSNASSQQNPHSLLLQQQQQQPQLDHQPEYSNESINCFTNDAYNNQIHILTPASISPGAYSMQSSSPALHDVNIATTLPLSATQQTIDTNFLTTTTPSPPSSAAIKHEISALPLNESALYANQLAQLPVGAQYEGILLLQTKLKDEIDLEDDPTLSDEKMLEAMDWLNNQQISSGTIVHES